MSDQKELIVDDLHARIDGKEILRGIRLRLPAGEVHALMGPNGSGKSTLANVIMGHPLYEVTGGEIFFGGKNILESTTDERARLGIFLAFQYPVGITGITVAKFLKRALDAKDSESGKTVGVVKFIHELKATMDFLEMDKGFIDRYLNDGFSGGEKKRMEIVQMLMIKPEFAILDETDSGLDIDALKVVAKGVNKLRGPAFGALVITHYQRILDYIRPDRIHIMHDGRIVTSGGPELGAELEKRGYDWVRKNYG